MPVKPRSYEEKTFQSPLKKGLGEEMYNKERRRLAIERTFSGQVPQSAKAVDYVKFVREDRDR
jgi:hypothetical protein